MQAQSILRLILIFFKKKKKKIYKYIKHATSANILCLENVYRDYLLGQRLKILGKKLEAVMAWIQAGSCEVNTH
jgi:hypothetical protein